MKLPGGEIAARVTERCFHHLEAPVLRVAGFDIPDLLPMLEAAPPARRRPDPGRRGAPAMEADS